MELKRVVFFTVASMVLTMSFFTEVNAASINLSCRIGSGGSRSVIKLRGTGMKGKYYAKIFSGENMMQAEDKFANSNGVIDFKFDSDPKILTNFPYTTEITTNFIEKREVVGVLRKAGSLARIGAVRTTCRNLKTRATQ
jgi:hypothetical protein